MKSLNLHQVARLFITGTAGAFLTADTITTTFQNHDSVKVATLVVKENRESLLRKLPKVTLRPAEQGNTKLPTRSRVYFLSPITLRKRVCTSSIHTICQPP